jgi:hypothetical protein
MDFEALVRGPRLDAAVWEAVDFATPEGPVRAVDDNARIAVGNGEIEVAVVPFSKSHPRFQVVDNQKFLYLAKHRYPLQPGKTVHFDVEMAAEVVDSEPREFFNAYVTFSVDDLDRGLVFNIAANGKQVRALYEDLPGFGRTPFCYFIEHPNVAPLPVPGEYMRCRISFGPGAEQVRYFVDGSLLFEVMALPAPVQELQIGMGIFSDIPLGRDGSRSNRGQGAIGKWRRFRVTSE